MGLVLVDFAYYRAESEVDSASLMYRESHDHAVRNPGHGRR